MVRTALVATALLLAASSVRAAPDAVVEALQAPAWLTRDGKRLPLAVGTELRNGDEVATGMESRALLRLADGSRVKLGEKGALKLESLSVQRSGAALLRATLRVLEGAFRFTTAVASGTPYRRHIDVQFTTLTAGIRGTDIWGRNFGDREVVALIEGRVTVSRGTDAAVELKDAGTYYQAPIGGEPGVQTIPAELLSEWAQQTEIQRGRGAQSQIGAWKLDIARFDNQDEALALYDSLRRDGFPARILPRAVDGGQIYFVRLTGFSTRAEARALGERLGESYPGISPAPSR
jgi:cell division septation protein DedD